ncbi:hypothetical protein ALQ76_102237 [Pseudomonas syringae pv. atrofaciens]|nr:hypothetical protein ALQ76_102237 [Pseudomonas syringae pv. atrofaciens]
MLCLGHGAGFHSFAGMAFERAGKTLSKLSKCLSYRCIGRCRCNRLK